MEQGSQEWFDARLGLATASRFKDAMMLPKYAGYKNYAAQLVAERLTGKREESYTSREMEWGTEMEPLARKYYEKLSGNKVYEIGFVNHPQLQAGASPDGLIDDDGGLEIKCPNTATHIQTLISKQVPPQYKWQVYGGMWIANRQWWDFMSFDPRLPLKQRCIIIRVQRDEAMINQLSKGIESFLNEVDKLEQQLTNM